MWRNFPPQSQQRSTTIETLFISTAVHIGPQIKQAVWRVFTDYALLNYLPYWYILLMDEIDILYDVVGGDLLVVQSAFHFSSVKESRKEEACAVVLAEHNHTLPMGGVLHTVLVYCAFPWGCS